MAAFALLSTVPRVTDAVLERIAAAARLLLPQIDAEWSPIYSELAAPMGVRVVSAVSELTDDDVPMLFTPTIDDPQALAYHTIKDGHPYGLILADDTQTIAGIEQAALHEIGECRLDPSCDLYVDDVALEAHDPLQGDVVPYDLGERGVLYASPFICRGYFPSFHAAGPTNSASLALAPLGVRPAGYIVEADGTQVMGERYVAPAHRGHWHTRPSKRNRARGKRIGLLK